MWLIGCQLDGFGLSYYILRYWVYLLLVVPVQGQTDQSGTVVANVQLKIDHTVASLHIDALVAVQGCLITNSLVIWLVILRQSAIKPPERQLVVPPILGVKDNLTPLLIETKRLPSSILITLQP